MNAENTRTNSRAQLGGLGLFVVLVALPYATNWMLTMTLLGSPGFRTPASAAVGMAVFAALTIVMELTVARRWPSVSYERSGIMFDPKLSFGEKRERLRSSPTFSSYLSAQLIVVCLLSVATAILR
jgi:hypothetical protein